MDGWGRLVPCMVKIQILWEKRAVGRCIMTVCLKDSPLIWKFWYCQWLLRGGKGVPRIVRLLRKDKN